MRGTFSLRGHNKFHIMFAFHDYKTLIFLVHLFSTTFVTPTSNNVSKKSSFDAINQKVNHNSQNNNPLDHRHKKPQIELPEDTGSEVLEESNAKQYCFETCNSNVNKCAAEKICPDKYRVV